MALLSHIFQRLGIPLATHKTAGPTHCLEYLGIILDSNLMEARLPKEKLIRISNWVLKFINHRSCTKREMLSVIGHLVFASKVVMPGRTFISRLIEASKKVRELYHRVTITADCRADLRMWTNLLSKWNGISMFLEKEPTLADNLHLFTDASGTIGFGGFYHGDWFASAWDTDLLASVKSDLSIAFQELYPIVVAAILWGKHWARKRIMFHCDNKAVVYILNKGRSPCTSIMKLMRRLVIVSAMHNFQFLAKYVSTHNNGIADSLSRLDFQRFRLLAPEAATQACKIPSEVLFC